MANVLIIDDDRSNMEMLFDMISDMGHKVTCAFTAEEGLRKAASHAYDVVFLDVQLPDGNGLMLLPDIQGTSSAPEVIIITGLGNPDGAELAIRNGTWDFIEKPLVRSMIELPLVRALQYREAKKGKKGDPCAPAWRYHRQQPGNGGLYGTCRSGIRHERPGSHHR